jgi:outer membrane protein TolC
MLVMRLKQQISEFVCPRATRTCLAALFAFGLPLSVFGQTAPPPAAPPAPAVQAPAAAAAPNAQGTSLGITPDEAVRLALQNNLGIQAERLAPQIQTYLVSQARAAYAPNLFSVTTKRNSTSPPDFLTSGGVSNATTSQRTQTNVGLQQNVPWGGGSYSVALNASRLETTSTSSFNPQLGSTLSMGYTQPLLRDFKIDAFRQQLLVSKKNQEIADVQLLQQVTVTSRAVRSAYYDLVGAIEGLQVAQQSLDLARESLKNNETRVQVGTMAPIDITEAQAEVASNEEAVITAESRIRTAEDRLRALVLNPSQPDFWTTRLQPTEQPVLTPVAIDIDAAVNNALTHRTDLLQARKQMETTDINLQYARNQKLPAMNVTASYNTVGVGGTQFEFGPGFPPTILSQTQRSFTDALHDVFANQFKTWSVELNVSYPLGTSAAEAGLAATRLQKQAQTTSLKDMETSIATAVRDAGRQVTTNLKRVEATRKARELAERRLEAEQKRMTVGLSTTFQLFQAQRDLARQRQNELNALIDYNRSLVDFDAVQIVPIR